MTRTIRVYATGASATPATALVPAPEHSFPWRAASTSDAADQAWFWTREWQAGEREVDDHLAAGRTERFDSVDEFLAALDRQTG